MRILQHNRLLSVTICMITLSISTLAVAQVSSTEQAVMDKILKLKSEIDEIMMKPGSSSDKAAMDKVIDMKRDIDTFLGLLPPNLQEQVQKKMAQSGKQTSDGAGAESENLPFVMAPEDIQKVEMALMRSQLTVLKRIAVALRQGETLDARTQGQWIEFIESVAGSGMETDVPSLTKYVMREAYAEQNKGLDDLGSTVRFHRDMRSKLRDEIGKVKKLVDAVPGTDGPLSEAIQKKRIALGLDGKIKLQPGPKIMTKTDAINYLQELEQHLTTNNEKAEQAALELEKILLKQQPKLKAMSDLSQKLQDTGQTAIQNEQ